MKTRSILIALFAVLLTAAQLSAGLIAVDNRAGAGGDGSIDHPYRTIGEASAASQESDAIYVAPSPTPYVETVNLKPGQSIVGAGDDEIIRSRGLDLPSTGSDFATIHGTVNVSSDNTIARLTVVSDSISAVSGSGSRGRLVIRNVLFRTSNGAFGIVLNDHSGDVTVNGGGLESGGNGGGVAVLGGFGNVFFDRFPISGSFSTAIRVAGHRSGFVLFRDGSDIRIENATQDAVVAENLGTRSKVVFSVPLSIRTTGARGILASHVQSFGVTGDTTIETTNAAALELDDSGGDVTIRSVSASGGSLQRGIRINRFRGHVKVEGGTIRGAAARPVELLESSGVELSGLVIEHGGAVVANKVRDATLSGLQIKDSAGILLNDIDGTIRLSRITSNSPLNFEQLSGSGRLVLDRCRLDGHVVKIRATNEASVVVELDATDLSGSGINASADRSAHIALSIRGGRLTRSKIVQTAADRAGACIDISGARFTPAEDAIRVAVTGDAKINVAGAHANDAPSVRKAIADGNNGAGVVIDVPVASLSVSNACQ